MDAPEQTGRANHGSAPEPDAVDALSGMAAIAAARRTLLDLLAGAQALSLLRAASAHGLIDAARVPRTPDQLAAMLGLPVSRVADLCLALDTFGLFDRRDDAYVLAPSLAPLIGDDAPQSLQGMVDYVALATRLVAEGAATQAYATLDPSDMIAWAAGQSPRPATPLAVAGRRRTLAPWPELQAIYASEARELELGCGLAGRLLTALVCHPELRAVAVEIQPRLLEEARRRAENLGVADRVEFRLMDARDVTDDAAFDLAFWSQFFFPAPTRSATLAAARRALKPGGYLVTSLLTDPPSTPEGIRQPLGRDYAWRRLLYGGAGIPVLSSAEVRAEVEAAGFTFVRAGELGPSPVLLARRPIG